jgi:hypothetical protein
MVEITPLTLLFTVLTWGFIFFLIGYAIGDIRGYSKGLKDGVKICKAVSLSYLYKARMKYRYQEQILNVFERYFKDETDL